MVTSWSAWSPCSATCGIGFTLRVREYMNKDLESLCNTTLLDKKNCTKDSKSAKCRNNYAADPTEKIRICNLDADKGPCRRTKNNTRKYYYYNRDKKMCMEFDYGGCR